MFRALSSSRTLHDAISLATTMTSQMVLDAVEQAIWTRHRQGKDLAGLVAHHDHGVQYLSVAYSEHLAAAGIKPSTGAVGSSYDNALAEWVIGLYKTELVKPRRALEGPRRPRDRHRRIRRLVQQPTALRLLRRPHTRRSRARSLRSPPESDNRRGLKLESLRTRRGDSDQRVAGRGALQDSPEAGGDRPQGARL